MSVKKKTQLESHLKRLKEISEKMQAGQISFDENVELFKEGMTLIKESRSYLDSSELLIKQLIEGENGQEEVEMED